MHCDTILCQLRVIMITLLPIFARRNTLLSVIHSCQVFRTIWRSSFDGIIQVCGSLFLRLTRSRSLLITTARLIMSIEIFVSPELPNALLNNLRRRHWFLLPKFFSPDAFDVNMLPMYGNYSTFSWSSPLMLILMQCGGRCTRHVWSRNLAFATLIMSP